MQIRGNKAEEQPLWNWRVDQLPKREEEQELQKLIHTPVFVPFNVKKRHFHDLFKILLSCVAFGFCGCNLYVFQC